MRNCLNCGRRMRCNRIDRSRNEPCSEWTSQEIRKVSGTGTVLMLIGLVIMILITYMNGPAWISTVLLLGGLLVGMIGGELSLLDIKRGEQV